MPGWGRCRGREGRASLRLCLIKELRKGRVCGVSVGRICVPSCSRTVCSATSCWRPPHFSYGNRDAENIHGPGPAQTCVSGPCVDVRLPSSGGDTHGCCFNASFQMRKPRQETHRRWRRGGWGLGGSRPAHCTPLLCWGLCVPGPWPPRAVVRFRLLPRLRLVPGVGSQSSDTAMQGKTGVDGGKRPSLHRVWLPGPLPLRATPVWAGRAVL